MRKWTNLGDLQSAAGRLRSPPAAKPHHGQNHKRGVSGKRSKAQRLWRLDVRERENRRAEDRHEQRDSDGRDDQQDV
jgi:hypothetical protein